MGQSEDCLWFQKIIHSPKREKVNQLLGKNDYALVENTINKSNKGFRVQTNYYVGYEKIAVAYNDYFASCAF